MLSAILNGKGRRLPVSLPAGASLRMAFVQSEDILTATVFERLAYLEGSVLWALLVATFKPRVLPERKVAELTGIEFWPTWWPAGEGVGRSVEPDVVMRFSVGDPSMEIVLVVECKLGGMQYPAQWAREWIAARSEGATDAADETYLLALGGLPATAAVVVDAFTGHLRETAGIEVKAAAADWRDLLRALDGLDVVRQSDRRVVSDVKGALALHGYAEHVPMADLAAMTPILGIQQASTKPLRWSEEPSQPNRARGTATTASYPPADDLLSGWNARVAGLLGLRDHSNLRWSGDDAG